jgi:hypothetical protein
MKSRRFLIACMLITLGVMAASTHRVHAQTATADPALPPFEFHREGAKSPEAAATSLFRGCALRSPQDFVRHLNLGVCDGPIATLTKFAECLHTTKFTTGKEAYTVFDLPQMLNKATVRVIGSREFDSQAKDVMALRLEGASTYYGKRFALVDVAADGYDGRVYQTRIVVATVSDGWYAIPRCRSSRSFYRIADAMDAPAPAEAN